MRNTGISFLSLGILFLNRMEAFVPVRSLPSVPSSVLSTRLTVSSVDVASTPIIVDSFVQSTNLLLGSVTSDDFGDLAKSAVIVLFFGGGLIPASISANKALIGTLTGGSKKEIGNGYITDSGVSGPALPGSILLFANEEVKLVDVIAVVGRIQSAEKLCDWRNLPSTETSPNVMWLPRRMYKEIIRKSKFARWPNDPSTGEPVGGKDLKLSEEKRISKTGALISDSALDAVFDSWAWGASVATQDKVEATLLLYKNGNSFDVGEFAGAAARGRAVTGIGALSFVVIQVIAYGTLFVGPILRKFFDIDIGFGQFGG